MDMNSHIEFINNNILAVNFYYVDMGFIQELHFLDNTNDTTKKIVTISENGLYAINKSFDKQDVQNIVEMLNAIIELNGKQLFTKQGFCDWIRRICPSVQNKTDEAIMKAVVEKQLENFWTIYQNLCKAEIKRRQVKKNWMHQHPLSFINRFKG